MKKLEGCNTVSFVANCSGGANLGEGSFNWKENSKSQKGSLTEQSKQFAMANNPAQSSDGGDKELLQQKQQYIDEINSLKKQISANDKKQQDLIDRIRAAKQANNYPWQTNYRRSTIRLMQQTHNCKSVVCSSE